MVDNIVKESTTMGMAVNVGKTEVQHIGSQRKEVTIKIEDHDLNQVKEFVYLGGTISDDATTDNDIQRRIGLACGVMQSLNPVWKSKEISRGTKAKLYEALVLSVLLYNSETWTLKEEANKKLRVFEMNCLRKIKGVTRRDRIRNIDIKAELSIDIDIIQRIQRKRLKYFEHVVRMKSDRYPNIALFGNVHGARKRGRPRKRWFKNLEEDLEQMGMDIVEACRTAASDREKWRKSVLRLSMRGFPSP